MAPANPELADFIDDLAKSQRWLGTVLFKDQWLDRAALRALATKYDPSNGRRYIQVAGAMDAEDATVEMPDGRVMTKRDLYVEAIRLEPTQPEYYDALRKALGPDETVEMADGRVVGERDLQLAAIECAHGWDKGTRYSALAFSLKPGETIALPDGREAGNAQL